MGKPMKVEPTHARDTGMRLDECAADPTSPERAREWIERPELEALRTQRVSDDDARIEHFEPGQEFVSDAMERLSGSGVAGIEVVSTSEDMFLARFVLQLASVSSAALANDVARWSESGSIVQGEAARQRALASLACSLQPSQRVRFIHLTSAHQDQSLRYRMLVEGEAVARTALSAGQLGRELLGSLRSSLAVGAGHLGFEGQSQPEQRERWHDCVDLVPAAITVQGGPGLSIGTLVPGSECKTLLPMVPTRLQTYFDGIVTALTSLPVPIQLVVEWQGLQTDAHLRSLVEHNACLLLDANSKLVRLARRDGLSAEAQSEEVRRTHHALQNWLAEPLGALMRVRLQSVAPVPLSLARMIGYELFLGRPFAVCQATDGQAKWSMSAAQASDLGGLVTRDMPVPPLFPPPLSVDAQGFRRHFPVVEFDMPAGGTVIGDSPSRIRNREIRLADRDRDQHCYVAGQTGSGKTRGLLEPMALQDMTRGCGVFYPDMDGDTFDYLHAACPPSRRDDIVSLDFTDFDASPALNLLQFQTDRPRIERGFIVDNLVQIFKQQYPDTPEGFGPVFELYLTNAAYLVMEEPGSTVLEIVQVFSDALYRRRLLSICKDPLLSEFWGNIAVKAGGEASLENIAPYIVSKLTKMVDDELVKRVVGQSESTIDFRAGMGCPEDISNQALKGFAQRKGGPLSWHAVSQPSFRRRAIPRGYGAASQAAVPCLPGRVPELCLPGDRRHAGRISQIRATPDAGKSEPRTTSRQSVPIRTNQLRHEDPHAHGASGCRVACPVGGAALWCIGPGVVAQSSRRRQGAGERRVVAVLRHAHAQLAGPGVFACGRCPGRVDPCRIEATLFRGCGRN